MSATTQGKTPAQWAEDKLTLKGDKPLLFRLDDGLKRYMRMLKRGAKKERKSPEELMKELTRQNPSNPHGLSYRDAPAPEGGLRGGE